MHAYSYGSESEAREAASRFRQGDLEPSKVIIRVEVRAHAWSPDGTPIRWGAWPVWRYADREDPTEFGGPFIHRRFLDA